MILVTSVKGWRLAIRPSELISAIFLIVFFTMLLLCLPIASDGLSLEPGGLPAVSYDDNFYGVDFIDSRQGWIVGISGTILTTADGGNSWQRQQSGTYQPLFDVCFVDNSNGWVVGKSGTILATGDGGKHWSVQTSDFSDLLSGVHFVSRQEGWAVGVQNSVIHTANGGKTWDTQLTGKDVILNGVHFVDASHGWVVGEFGTILATRDGGKSWETQGENIDIRITDRVRGAALTIRDLSLYGVYFRDARHGWIVGIDGVMFKTEDGGEHWQTLPRVVTRSLFDIRIREGKGWAVGHEGNFIVSLDGGTTWSRPDPSPLPTQFWLYRLDFINTEEGWIVGAHSHILHTQDGGKSWSKQG